MKKALYLVVAVLMLSAFAGQIWAQTAMDIGPYGRTYSSTTTTRGYWFTAPTDFTIVGLRVPTDVGTAPQNIEVVRFNAPPPSWSGTTNDFTSLGRWTGIAGTNIINTNIPVSSGDIIGILGARGTSTMNNSYGQVSTYDTTIFGQPLTLRRLGMQYNLYTTPAQNLWTENATYSRIELYYDSGGDPDNDGDGWTVGEGDCNDNDPNINPGATEIVDDGVDQNCDGGELCYVDADDDTYRPDAFSTIASVDLDCTDSGEAQASDPTGDCNDGNPAINPGAADIPDNGIDEDCNGFDATLCIVDADMDSYGTSLGITVVAPDGTCDTAQGESTTADDCNDGDAAIHPGAEEVCDGVDNNCDGQIDEACTSVDHINGQFVRTRQGIQLKAFVFVADSGGPVVGVEVEATLDVPGVGTGIVKMATTNADGRATFKVTSTKPRGDWNLCVTDINTPGYTFIAGPGDCNTWPY